MALGSTELIIGVIVLIALVIGAIVLAVMLIRGMHKNTTPGRHRITREEASQELYPDPTKRETK